MKTKMMAKNLCVSFLAVAMIMALVANVSAATDITSDLQVKVDGDWIADATGIESLSVEAGETINVKAMFLTDLVPAGESVSDVIMKVEIEGNKLNPTVVSETFDVESNQVYIEDLDIKVPYELKDEVSEDVTLIVTVKKGNEYKTVREFTLRVQRPSYNADVMSIVTSNTVQAGESFPVDIVLKNVGYNDLEDVYITAKLSALNGVERTVYFGDLVSLEDADNDDESTSVNGRVVLQMPYDAEAGIYTLDVQVKNDDLDLSVNKQIVVENDFPRAVIKAGNDLMIVNPTDDLKIYRVVYPDSEELVTVAAGSAETVVVNPNSEEYTVSVLSMNGELVDTFTFNAVEGSSATSPIVVLTIILAIVFLVLLVVLIVLIGKKPEKSEDFGESYY